MVSERTIRANGLDHYVAVAGAGPAIVLLHGFPHTWQVWGPVLDDLARHRTVVAPDLRGLGGSARPVVGGYTAADVVADVLGILDALRIWEADLVGLDLGAPAALLTALTAGDRVRSLVVMEALLGDLPGAEDFLAAGPPWWFGFHRVPGFAEQVLLGNEERYVDWFLDAGTLGDGPQQRFRAAVHAAYRAPGALHAAFEHYRAFPASAAQFAEAASRGRLTMPSLAVGGAAVGDATFRQLRPLADDALGVVLDGCGHIVPQHRPDRLLDVLAGFLTTADGRPRPVP